MLRLYVPLPLCIRDIRRATENPLEDLNESDDGDGSRTIGSSSSRQTILRENDAKRCDVDEECHGEIFHIFAVFENVPFIRKSNFPEI